MSQGTFTKALQLAHVRGPRLSDDQRFNWLRLIRTEGVGPITFKELLNRYGGAEAALEALPHLLQRAGRIGRIPPVTDIENELQRAAKIGAQLVAMGDPAYPALLRRIDDAPPLIYIRGDISLIERHGVAIVGSRNGSTAGRRMARDIAIGLGEAGFVVVSGLARGIDGAAHEAAIDAGTIAVLAGGIDHIYPPEHAGLHAAIGTSGLLVSERSPGAPPRAEDFPRRNRIVSGISLGVVVIEAAKRSGSLITARLAGEQGREVFAVPGHPLDPRAKGTLRLLADGATMCTSAQDVIDALEPTLEGSDPATTMREFSQEPSEDQAWDDGSGSFEAHDDVVERVLQALSVTPVSIDEIVRDTALSVATVRAALLMHDLAGRIERHGLQSVSRTAAR